MLVNHSDVQQDPFGEELRYVRTQAVVLLPGVFLLLALLTTVLILGTLTRMAPAAAEAFIISVLSLAVSLLVLLIVASGPRHRPCLHLQDEVEVALHPTLTGVWSSRGRRQRRVESGEEREAVSLWTGRLAHDGWLDVNVRRLF